MRYEDNKEVADIYPILANKSIPIGEDILKRLQKTIFLPWMTQITSWLRICSKVRKGNIEIALLTTRSQSRYSIIHQWWYRKWSEQTI